MESMPDDPLDSLDAPADAEEIAEEVEWSGDELEEAYLRALGALEAVEADLPPANLQELQPLTAAIVASTEGAAAHEANFLAEPPEPASAASPAATTPSSDLDPLVTPRQILEGCLFVGGHALSTKQITAVFRDEFSIDFLESEIERLNQQYAQENRPYFIQLGEGGYRLQLREEHERVRAKVYGMGPREVRLNQDALEVLALVAYRQPITQEEIQELGKPQCGAILRQLVRRELIAIVRDLQTPKIIRYQSTERFLQVFGLRKLADLPRPEILDFK